jgi:hypothetical protein
MDMEFTKSNNIGYHWTYKKTLLIVLTATFAMIFSFNIFGFSVYGQINETKSSNNSTSAFTIHPSGFYMIQFSISGGFAPVDETFTYNIITHELNHVTNEGVNKKLLNETEINRINDAFFKYPIGNLNIIDFKTCPDCRQYALSYGYVESEKRIKLSNFDIWNDGTKMQGVNELNNFANVLVEISQGK